MKTGTLIGIGIIGMAVVLAPRARADFAISISFGSPAVYHAPVVVTPPPPPICPPRVVVAPPPVVVARPPVYYAPAPVYVPPPPVCRPAVFIPPGHLKKYDRHGGRHGWDRKAHGKSSWGKHGRH